ncbi:MAG TPA: right-handed parallel beta-helix repeat-containing protein [Thermoleophilaceae bacterium]|nr:right-handed parallel beta-helix repeat-containing protein [Thermoleophilaceae bacterium]
MLVAVLALCQPAAAAVYKVPPKIKSNCSAPVERQITDWLRTVPNGSTVQFGAGRCYAQDGPITLSGRSGLVIEGQGSEFRAVTPGTSHRANWRFVGGADLTVQNMAVRGSNPQGTYDPSIEWQHGYSIEGVQGMTLTNVQARDTWGDGVYLAHSTHTPACGDDASSARNVVISGATLERNGRQGVAIVDAEHVTLQDSTIGPVAWWSVDIETDDACEIARHVKILRNSFGAHRYGVLGSVGFGVYPQVGDLTVIDNTQTVPTRGLPGDYCWAPVWILAPVNAEGRVVGYRENYAFRGNRLLGTRNGFEFRGVRNIELSANNVALPPTTGCGKRAGALLADSHTVNMASNSFSGANNVFVADALSTGVTSTDNTLN